MIFHLNSGSYTSISNYHLTKLIALHGGVLQPFFSKGVTHVLTHNLSASKVRDVTKKLGLAGQVKYVHPDFVMDAIRSGKLPVEKDYLVINNANKDALKLCVVAQPRASGTGPACHPHPEAAPDPDPDSAGTRPHPLDSADLSTSSASSPAANPVTNPSAAPDPSPTLNSNPSAAPDPKPYAALNSSPTAPVNPSHEALAAGRALTLISNHTHNNTALGPAPGQSIDPIMPQHIADTNPNSALHPDPVLDSDTDSEPVLFPDPDPLQS